VKSVSGWISRKQVLLTNIKVVEQFEDPSHFVSIFVLKLCYYEYLKDNATCCKIAKVFSNEFLSVQGYGERLGKIFSKIICQTL